MLGFPDVTPNSREGAMEPSWTSPIPQAMQQHRGSQLHKPKPADPKENVVPPDTVALAAVTRPGEVEGGGGTLIWA
jgi:hypothetical protein